MQAMQTTQASQASAFDSVESDFDINIRPEEGKVAEDEVVQGAMTDGDYRQLLDTCCPANIGECGGAKGRQHNHHRRAVSDEDSAANMPTFVVPVIINGLQSVEVLLSHSQIMSNPYRPICMSIGGELTTHQKTKEHAHSRGHIITCAGQ